MFPWRPYLAPITLDTRGSGCERILPSQVRLQVNRKVNQTEKRTAPSRHQENEKKLAVCGLAHRFNCHDLAMAGGKCGGSTPVGEVGASPIVEGDWLVRLGAFPSPPTSTPTSLCSPTSTFAPFFILTCSPSMPATMISIAKSHCHGFCPLSLLQSFVYSSPSAE